MEMIHPKPEWHNVNILSCYSCQAISLLLYPSFQIKLAAPRCRSLQNDSSPRSSTKHETLCFTQVLLRSVNFYMIVSNLPERKERSCWTFKWQQRNETFPNPQKQLPPLIQDFIAFVQTPTVCFVTDGQCHIFMKLWNVLFFSFFFTVGYFEYNRWRSLPSPVIE